MLITEYIKRELVKAGNSPDLVVVGYDLKVEKQAFKVLGRRRRMYDGQALVHLSVKIDAETLLDPFAINVGVLTVKSTQYKVDEDEAILEIRFCEMAESKLAELS